MHKVLVIDDDAPIRTALTEVLQAEGFQVKEAASGQEALDILQHEAGGWVLLLDLYMPGMSGQEVLKNLETHLELLEATQIILMSAGWRLARVRQLPQTDLVSAALEKPFDLDRMLTLVTRLAR